MGRSEQAVSTKTVEYHIGHLLGKLGARMQPDFELRTAPSAGAISGCDIVCALIYNTGCWAFCFFFGPVGGIICGIVFCGVAGTVVCGNICE